MSNINVCSPKGCSARMETQGLHVSAEAAQQRHLKTPPLFQSVSVDGATAVSSVTLPATAAVLKDGVTCEVSNEHGAESKVVPVAVKKG